MEVNLLMDDEVEELSQEAALSDACLLGYLWRRITNIFAKE